MVTNLSISTRGSLRRCFNRLHTSLNALFRGRSCRVFRQIRSAKYGWCETSNTLHRNCGTLPPLPRVRPFSLLLLPRLLYGVQPSNKRDSASLCNTALCVSLFTVQCEVHGNGSHASWILVFVGRKYSVAACERIQFTLLQGSIPVFQRVPLQEYTNDLLPVNSDLTNELRLPRFLLLGAGL